jgi:hypothetical protein
MWNGVYELAVGLKRLARIRHGNCHRCLVAAVSPRLIILPQIAPGPTALTADLCAQCVADGLTVPFAPTAGLSYLTLMREFLLVRGMGQIGSGIPIQEVWCNRAPL